MATRKGATATKPTGNRFQGGNAKVCNATERSSRTPTLIALVSGVAASAAISLRLLPIPGSRTQAAEDFTPRAGVLDLLQRSHYLA
jgi:hypothetical protein